MSYTKTQWNNDTAPAINETNLNKIEQGIYDNDSHIGDLTTLTTTADTDLVSAINEVDSHADTNATNIGDLSNLTTTANTDLVSAVNEVNSKENGIIKNAIENNKFLKLFTLQFTASWKSSSVYFTLANVQNNTFSQLINLYIRRDNTATTITNFSCISYTGNLKSDLVAVITDSDTVEVYYKCHDSDSPALNILANPKMDSNITVDMETLVTTLPTGTATYVSDLKVANSTLWDGLTRDTATENNLDTWIAVLKDDKLQHTTINSIVSRGIKSKNISGTPDSNGFISLGLSITNVVLGFTNNAGARFILPFYENNANRITAQILSWDKNPITTNVDFTVYYI